MHILSANIFLAVGEKLSHLLRIRYKLCQVFFQMFYILLPTNLGFGLNSMRTKKFKEAKVLIKIRLWAIPSFLVKYLLDYIAFSLTFSFFHQPPARIGVTQKLRLRRFWQIYWYQILYAFWDSFSIITTFKSKSLIVSFRWTIIACFFKRL